MNKDTFTFILKIVVAIATSILTILGAQALTSCAVKHYIDVKGRGTVITVDTTIVNHSGYLYNK